MESKLTKEWSAFIPEEGYEKSMQDIQLKDGSIVLKCWPNAGVFVCCSDNEVPDTPCENVAFVRLTHKW